MQSLDFYFIDQQGIGNAALDQLEKEWARVGLKVSIERGNYTAVTASLSIIIAELLNNKTELFFKAVYLMDLSEIKVKEALNQPDAIEALCHLMLRRMLEKVLYRAGLKP